MGDPVTDLVPVIVQDVETGRVLMQGSAAEISVNPDVRKAYLGL